MAARHPKGDPRRRARQDRANERLAARIASNYTVEDERQRLRVREASGYNVAKERAKLEARTPARKGKGGTP